MPIQAEILWYGDCCRSFQVNAVVIDNAKGETVMRNNKQVAARPDGERARARNQPPSVPKMQKIWNLGGFVIATLFILSMT